MQLCSLRLHPSPSLKGDRFSMQIGFDVRGLGKPDQGYNLTCLVSTIPIRLAARHSRRWLPAAFSASAPGAHRWKIWRSLAESNALARIYRERRNEIAMK
jgi:hypothetical protein